VKACNGVRTTIYQGGSSQEEAIVVDSSSDCESEPIALEGSPLKVFPGRSYRLVISNELYSSYIFICRGVFQVLEDTSETSGTVD
jgi:hypothetical protein